MPFAVRLPR